MNTFIIILAIFIIYYIKYKPNVINNLIDNNFIFNIKKRIIEKFEDKYNLHNDLFDKQYVDIYNIISNDKKGMNNDVKLINDFLKNKIKDKNMLDFGCRTGYLTSMFNNNGYKIIGVDRSRNMLKKASLENSDCDYIRGDIKNNNLFKYNTQNIIHIGRNTINYYNEEDIVKIIKNCNNWLKDKGYLILNTYSKDINFYPREYSQLYNNNRKDNIDNVSFTYLKNFRYDNWFQKKKEKYKYNFYEKVVLENGKYRIKNNELTILPIKKIINILKKNNFKLSSKIDNRYKYQRNNIYIFQKI